MNETIRVLISESLSSRAEEILTESGSFEVLNRPGLSRKELLELTKDIDALIVRSATRVDEAVLGAGGRLKIVARAGIGVDNIDLESASRRGVLVVNAPDGNVVTTAEHTIAMMTALARNIPQAVLSVKEGKWERRKFVGVELHSKTLGIIGLGRVGSVVARLAQGLGMNVLAYDPFISEEAAAKRGVRLTDLDGLLAQSHYITLHVPKMTESKHIIGADEIEKMRPGVRIINCSRGGLIDGRALEAELEKGRVAGVALDVYDQEPPDASDPLVGRDDVVCTPHLGASTDEAQINVAVSVAQQIVSYLTKGIVKYAVNFPSLGPEDLERVGPYLDLAERLGSFLAQLAGGGVRTLEVAYGGPLENPMESLTAAALKGILGHFLSGERVNLVNGVVLARERGIDVVTTMRSERGVYTDLVELTVKTDASARSVAGTFVRPGEPRIVRIDAYDVDAHPDGHMLIFTNEDQPGMIGKIGTLLGNYNVNIAGMQLGRLKKNDRAVAILNLDDPIPDEVMEEIRSLPNIFDANLVQI